MAKSTRADRAREAATSAGSNPYVRRLIEDEELRHSIRSAFDAAKHAYGRMANGKGPAHALMDDKKVQRDLRDAASSLREASDRLRGRRERKGGILGKLIVVGLVGGALALILSEDLRKTVLDRLFGAEEEFEYSSTTSPAAAPATNAS
jgi:hypothetical protein